MDITECKGAKGEFGLGCSVGKYVLGSYMYPHVVAFQNFSLLINIVFFNTSNNSDFDRNVDHKLWPTTAIGLYLTFCSDTCVKILPELEASIYQRDNVWVFFNKAG